MQRFKMGMASALMLVAGGAVAAVPQAATDAFSTLLTDTGTIVGYVWTGAIAVVVGLALIGLTRKGIKKAAS